MNQFLYRLVILFSIIIFTGCEKNNDQQAFNIDHISITNRTQTYTIYESNEDDWINN